MSRYLAWIDTPLNRQVEMIAHLEWAGVVVPVGPDYEAAWGYARHEDNGWIAAKKNENLVVLDKADVMAAVDTALGIGGDE